MVKYGLITTKSYYIPAVKIKGLMIKETLISRIVIPILMYIKLKTIVIICYMILSVILIAILYFFKRISINEKYILISTGFIIKNVSLILYDSVKYIKISDGIISEKFNIYNVNMYITSKYINSKQKVGYVTKNNLKKIRRKCLHE